MKRTTNIKENTTTHIDPTFKLTSPTDKSLIESAVRTPISFDVHKVGKHVSNKDISISLRKSRLCLKIDVREKNTFLFDEQLGSSRKINSHYNNNIIKV